MDVPSVTREEFLRKSGFMLATTTLALVGGSLAGCQAQPTATPQPPVHPWPWPYAQLDAQKAAQIAYDGYIGGHN